MGGDGSELLRRDDGSVSEVFELLLPGSTAVDEISGAGRLELTVRMVRSDRLVIATAASSIFGIFRFRGEKVD